jgi:hypothetical protein
MLILVCGSRHYDDAHAIRRALPDLQRERLERRERAA